MAFTTTVMLSVLQNRGGNSVGTVPTEPISRLIDSHFSRNSEPKPNYVGSVPQGTDRFGLRFQQRNRTQV